MDQNSRNEAIDNIYQKFWDEWTNNYRQLREAMEMMRCENPEEYPHKLGHFAILYTPIPDGEIDYMVIGNSPSWFHKDAKKYPEKAEDALKIIKGLEKAPPKTNLYLEGSFQFGSLLEKVFEDPPDVLENIVGLNRFWVQTGTNYSGFKKDLKKDAAAEEFKKIEEFCRVLTREIVSILQPKTVFLMGDHAQKTFNRVSMETEFVDIRHPSNGGVNLAKQKINDYFSND